jgi:MFS family permease
MSQTVAHETKPGLREDLKALLECPRELWLIYLATFFEYLGIFSFLQTLPLWLSSDYGMTDQQAGWWAATFSTLVTLFVFLVGSIADAVGVRRMLILSFGLAALGRLAMSLAPNQPAAIGALLAFGFAYATTSPVLQTAVQRASTPRTRAFAFSLWYVSFNVAGAVVGPVIDGVRGLFLTPDPSGGKPKLAPHLVDLPLLGERMVSAHAVILGLGFLTAAVAAVIVLFLRRDFEHRGAQDVPAAAKVKPFVALREVLADRAFWRFMLLLAFLALVKMMFQHMHFTWPKYVTREQGDDFPVGTVWSINALLIIVLAPLGTALTRDYKPLQVLLVGAFISALSPFALVFGSSMPYQLAMILLLTVGEALWSPRLYEYTVGIAPRGRESTYISLAVLPTFAAKFLVGPASGYLLATFCPEEGPRQSAYLWAIIGASTLVGPLGVLLLRGRMGTGEQPSVKPAVAA